MGLRPSASAAAVSGGAAGGTERAVRRSRRSRACSITNYVVKRHPGSLVRVCRRAHSDERGVTLLETIIAVTVVFGSLLMLAYTATIGFTYTGLARDRQSATGVANQIMEQVRGLATDRFVKGLSSSDLTGDPNIVLCGSDYHFKTCSGPLIVHTPGLTTSVPLVPHRGTVSEGFPTAFDWAVYVTNNDPATEPYLVTVIVSWTGGTSAGAHYVQSQSVVFDPKGCLDDTVHPFPGPCQPIFITDASRDSGRITINGTVSGLGTFSRAVLVLGGVRSGIQSEQVSLVQGTASQPGAELVLSSGTQTVGLSGASTSADGNPTTAAGTYSSSTLSPATAGSRTVTSTSPAGNSLTVSNGAGGDVGSTVSATSADALTAPCPLGVSENDHHPCGAASVRQASTLSATMVLDGLTVQLNNFTLARVLPEATASTTDTNFQEQAGADGLERETINRRVGTANLLNLPSRMTAPAGFTYLALLTNYSDTATAEVGTNTSAPSASINSGGLLSYWVTANCTTGVGAYVTVPVLSTPMTYQPSFCKTQRFSGKDVTVTMSGTVSTGGISTRQTASGSTRTSAQAIVKSPLKASLTYTIDIEGVTVVSLTLDVDLGQMVATGTYTAAPTG